jgi:hypothetical protein
MHRNPVAAMESVVINLRKEGINWRYRIARISRVVTSPVKSTNMNMVNIKKISETTTLIFFRKISCIYLHFYPVDG